MPPWLEEMLCDVMWWGLAFTMVACGLVGLFDVFTGKVIH